jgi:hypothetical protein
MKTRLLGQECNKQHSPEINILLFPDNVSNIEVSTAVGNIRTHVYRTMYGSSRGE